VAGGAASDPTADKGAGDECSERAISHFCSSICGWLCDMRSRYLAGGSARLSGDSSRRPERLRFRGQI
jgi:hypothetical protein